MQTANLRENTFPKPDEASERFIISCLINAPDESLEKVRGILPSEAFRCPRHRVIFEAIHRLHDQREPSDFLSLQQHLFNTGGLNPSEDAAWFIRFVQEYVTHHDLPRYIEKLQKTHVATRLWILGESIQARFSTPLELLDPFALAEEIQTQAFEITSSTRSGIGKIHHISHYCGEAIDDMEMCLKNKGKLIGVPTGFSVLDKVFGGFKGGQLIILAARPSVGKSALATNMVARAATTTGVALFSLEMPGRELVTRMLCSQSRVSLQSIRSGMMGKGEQSPLIQANSRLASLPIQIDETPSITLNALRGKVRRMVAKQGVGFIVIDYLQLMRSPSKKADLSRHLEVAEITGGLKELAKEMNIPILALAQLNRDIEKRKDMKPLLSDLRESGSIEQDADIVMLMHRDKEDPKTPTSIHVAKHRNGPLAQVLLNFNPQTSTFSDHTNH
jgi:replicative DNA helicase